MKEQIDKHLEYLLEYSFDKKATEDIFYKFIEMMNHYYKGKL